MKLKLYYPLKPLRVTQPFGATEIAAKYQANGINVVGHPGIDIAATEGQPVYACHDGICSVQVDVNGGHGVVLRTKEKFEYQDTECFFKTIYWHLQPNIPVVEGQEVKAGDLLGYADHTGFVVASSGLFGTHLHLGLKPMAINEDNGSYYNLEQTNGYLGNINPAPYFCGDYAQDLNTLAILTKIVECYKAIFAILGK